MEPVDAKQLNLDAKDYSYKKKNSGGFSYQYNTFKEASSSAEEVCGFSLQSAKDMDGVWMPLANLSAYVTIAEQKGFFEEQDIFNEDSAIRLWLFLQIITGHDHTAKNVFYVAKYDETLKHNYQFYFAPWDMDLTWGNVSVGEKNPYYTEFEMETVDDKGD